MPFIENQTHSKAANVNVEHLEHAVNNQLDGSMPPRVGVQPTRPLSIQARRASRAPALNLSMAANTSEVESTLMAPSMSHQDTIIGDPITHRIRTSKSSAGPTTPRAAIITTVPVTTTEAPVNGGVLFVPPTRPLNVRRCTNGKTRRSAKGKKSLAAPPITMAKSKSRNANMPPVRVTKSNGEVDMAQYRACALKLAGLPVD